MHSAEPLTDRISLYLSESKDGGVLLDLAHDRLLKLNSSGVVIWKLLSEGVTSDDIAKHLAQECEVDEARIRQDVQNLLKSAAELGLSPDCILLTQQQEQSTNQQNGIPSFRWYGRDANEKRPTTTVWSIVRAFLGLAMFDFILAFRSLAALCQRVQTWNIKPSAMGDRVTVIGETCSAVEKACVWYPKKALCLQRSAVTSCLLRSQGVAARMVIGVRPMPFLAHAWVEVDGAVVNDFPRVRTFYQSITAY